jgi:hypothetical protein
MRLTAVGNASEQVVISDLAIVTLRRPMDTERASSPALPVGRRRATA